MGTQAQSAYWALSTSQKRCCSPLVWVPCFWFCWFVWFVCCNYLRRLPSYLLSPLYSPTLFIFSLCCAWFPQSQSVCSVSFLSHVSYCYFRGIGLLPSAWAVALPHSFPFVFSQVTHVRIIWEEKLQYKKFLSQIICTQVCTAFSFLFLSFNLRPGPTM